MNTRRATVRRLKRRMTKKDVAVRSGKHETE